MKFSIRALIISLIIAVLAINAFSCLLGVVLNNTLLNSSFYDRFFARHHFYDILRLWILRRIGTELPYGREGLPYIEKGLTANWIRQEFIRISEQLFEFINNRTDELPELKIYRFKEAVMEHMVKFGESDKREEMLDYWLGPLPLNVRLQDITSVDFLWTIRRVTIYIRWIMYGTSIKIFFLIMLLLVITRSLWEAILWMSSALTAAATLIIAVTTQLLWLFKAIDYQEIWSIEVLTYGFQPDNVRTLFESFITAIADQFITISLFIAVISFLTICFVPIKTKV